MMFRVLALVGVAAFASTGALAAGRKKMDVFGVVVVAIVTAIGGGTLRDALLGRPAYWLSDPTFLLVAGAVGLATFIIAPLVTVPHRALLILDACGLALFTISGCEQAMTAHLSSVVVVIMGSCTGVAGGIIRDLLCNEVPLIFRPYEIYAVASLAGGAVFTALLGLGVGHGAASVAGIIVVLILRLASIHWGLALPSLSYTDSKAHWHRAGNGDKQPQPRDRV
jgi:uncharacterized membrane protein YeiH